MEPAVLSEEIQKIVFEQLPEIIREHPEVKTAIRKMMVDDYAPKQKTEDRFEMLLERMRIQDEKYERRHEEAKLRFEEHDRKFEKIFEKLEENDRKFEKIFEKLEENDRKFEKIFQELQENHRKFEENDRKFETMLKKIGAVDKRIDRTIGALGARWGLSTEQTFRKAIRSVIESFTDTQVERYLGFDNEGKVFGHPDQVEIDVVIRNGKLWVMEIKSSISKAEVYAFERKVAFYEKEKAITADRKAIVSPMFEKGAKEVAEKLGIEIYTAPEEME